MDFNLTLHKNEFISGFRMNWIDHQLTNVCQTFVTDNFGIRFAFLDPYQIKDFVTISSSKYEGRVKVDTYNNIQKQIHFTTISSVVFKQFFCNSGKKTFTKETPPHSGDDVLLFFLQLSFTLCSNSYILKTRKTGLIV